MKEFNCEAHIIGGGLIGLAAAYLMTSLGYKTILTEKKNNISKKTIFDDTRTIAISEGTKKFLNEIGLWRDINKFAEPIRKIKVIDRDISNNLNFDNFRRQSSLGYVVKNRIVHQIINKKISSLKGFKIFQGQEITHIHYESDKAVSRTKDININSDIIIAADGKNSSIRNLMKTPLYKKNYNKKALVITMKHSEDHNNIAYEYFFKDGPFAVLPMKREKGAKCSSVIWTHNKNYFDSLIKLSDKEMITILSEKLNNSLGKILSLTSKQLFPLSAHINTRFYENRLVYVGDSAHSIHPIAGQGWNLGMRDLKSLYDLSKEYKKLGIELGDKHYCHSFQQDTYYDTYRLFQITDKLDLLFRQNTFINNMFRSYGMQIIQRNTSLKNFISDFAMGI